MKLAVEFPSVAYRDGPEGVAKLAREIERIGYDQLDMFDHVVMGYALLDRPQGPYPPRMPILEALMTLSYVAAVTTRIGLGTEVLVLPQRQPVLVAKQISTLDTLSKGRVRLGIGVGWQESEYEALGENFNDRGRRMDEAIPLMRQYWSNERIDHVGHGYHSQAMAMEPKPPQGGDLPIWIGGHATAALRRVGALGDGWLAAQVHDAEAAKRAFDVIHAAAEEAGRDASKIGMQSMVSPPPRENDDAGREFFADHDRVAARTAEIKAMGFDWATINATAVFQSGSRSLDEMVDSLGSLHDRLRQEVGN
ncbi:MAG: TIGR03619 family F420-dependent LLM class oxidoreductase [Pseudomonadales bacterium]|jgi:probable F420-dependent oxidoreductase|nr:TIGR03619 family F420-dependent LLM class oxidoreductase [Gammaproteobacteria bacterium]